MNYLGHAYFSPDNDEILAGNVFGDFIKGKIENIKLPENIKYGLRLHRKLDKVCNQCEGYYLIKETIGKDYGHFNGVIADIFIDHFLSVYWENFSNISLEIFAESTYNKIEKSRKYFPKRFEKIFSYMKNDNWFIRNRVLKNIENILKRIEKYSENGILLQTSVNDIKVNPLLYKEYFYKFMNEMREDINNELIVDKS